MPPCPKWENHLVNASCDFSGVLIPISDHPGTLKSCIPTSNLFLPLGHIVPFASIDRPVQRDAGAFERGLDTNVTSDEASEGQHSFALKGTTETTCFSLFSNKLVENKACSQHHMHYDVNCTDDVAQQASSDLSSVSHCLNTAQHDMMRDSLTEQPCPPAVRRCETAVTFGALVPTAEELMSYDLFDDRRQENCSALKRNVKISEANSRPPKSRVDDCLMIDFSRVNTFCQEKSRPSFLSHLTPESTGKVAGGASETAVKLRNSESEQCAVMHVEHTLHGPIAPEDEHQVENHALHAEGKKSNSPQGNEALESSNSLNEWHPLVYVHSEMILRLKAVMQKSRQSQQLLQVWDSMNGLPRSHSWTMMHSNRSRRQLEENRVLLKWNGKLLIDEHGVSLDQARRKRKRRKRHMLSESPDSCAETMSR